MPFDFKKEYKEFYLPKNRPQIIDIPEMNFIAVCGSGDPNDEDGAYKQSIGILYSIAYTLKMSRKSGHGIDGYFEYVVPPLEGFWKQEGGIDYGNKSAFQWTSAIRLPDFISEEDFTWAAAEASRKKNIDCSPAKFITVTEGLCVQMMHIGPYDSEPASVALMDEYLQKEGYANDFSDCRLHHEIYISDPRRTDPAKLKTVIRHPIKKL